MPPPTYSTGCRTIRHSVTTALPARPLIDVALALDLLTAAVEGRGRSFVYPPVTHPDRECMFRVDGATRTLVEHALAMTGVSNDRLELLRRHSVRALHAEDRLPVRLTLGALIVLDTAQHSDDRGLRWGDALEHARRAVVRFIDLLPHSAIDQATSLRASAP